jgi:hypothetical protein
VPMPIEDSARATPPNQEVMDGFAILSFRQGLGHHEHDLGTGGDRLEGWRFVRHGSAILRQGTFSSARPADETGRLPNDRHHPAAAKRRCILIPPRSAARVHALVRRAFRSGGRFASG